MTNPILNLIDKKEILKIQKNEGLWDSFNTGDLISVQLVSSLDNKRKNQMIGVCISKKKKGLKSTFSIRNIIFGEGIEFTIPFYSPLLKDIHILNKKKTRASKLYYIRKFSNLKMKNF